MCARACAVGRERSIFQSALRERRRTDGSLFPSSRTALRQRLRVVARVVAARPRWPRRSAQQRTPRRRSPHRLPRQLSRRPPWPRRLRRPRRPAARAQPAALRSVQSGRSPAAPEREHSENRWSSQDASDKIQREPQISIENTADSPRASVLHSVPPHARSARASLAARCAPFCVRRLTSSPPQSSMPMPRQTPPVG